MRRKRFSFLVRQSLTVVAVAAVLISTGWAKPKFKILRGVPGGLFGGLTFDAKGNLYGVTGGGGDHNDGTIFQLKPGAHGWILTTLHSFDGYDGGSPNGGLIFDSVGNVYGTSPAGGIYGGGNVFEMTPGSGGWTFEVLYDFCLQYHCPDGGGPKAGLIIGDGGNLYGTTAGGGSSGEGVVFELTSGPEWWHERVLYNFDGNKGGIQPYAPLSFDPARRNLFGTTVAGGAYESGTVFKLTRASSDGWRERLLHSFHGYDGQGPRDGVIFDRSRNLYGTTRGGGAVCGGEFCGTIFKLARSPAGGWKETVLYGFLQPANGFYPSSGVVFDNAGNLYGTTAHGGIGICDNGCGVAYKMSPGANGKWKYTVLHKFSGTSGGLPPGDLALDRKGNLYGTAYNVVYEIIP